MLSTRITELLKIDYPVLQGGMAWISDGRLAAAVSNAGGFGIIAAGNADGNYIRQQIKIAKEMTDKPFGVNIMLMSPFADEISDVVMEENIAAVTTGAGNPAKYIKKWKMAGIKIIPVVASKAMAKLMTRLGADALIAEGTESGGHIGETTTICLVPQICDSTNLPVIAAGGIADGRGMSGTFMLGAEGIQMGTAFLFAEECSIHQNYKKRLINASDLDTVVTGRTLGHPVRGLKSPFSRKYLRAEFSGIPTAQLEKMGEGALRMAAKDGDSEKGSFLAGQVVSMLNKEEKAADIVKRICREAEECLKGGAKWVK